jgi:hypothetical protein
MRIKRVLSLSIVALAMATAAGATDTVALPGNSTQTTELTATVSEQATVTVPTAISFAVVNIGAQTLGSAAAVSVTGILLNTGKNLEISVKAGGDFVTTGSGTGTAFSAGDVIWTGGTGTHWTGIADSTGLSTSTFKAVATCDGTQTSCSTSDAGFKLKANSAVTLLGAQALTMTWHFASIDA